MFGLMRYYVVTMSLISCLKVTMLLCEHIGMYVYILSRIMFVCVTVDGVWNGEWIY
jgi:hypothetical protein